MNNRLITVLIALVVQSTHALPAYEAGEVIFHAHSPNALALPAMQMLLGVSTFLNAYGMMRAKRNHRKKIDTICGWVVGYLGVSTLAEVYLICFGSPLSTSLTACVAHIVMFVNGAVTLYLWERTGLTGIARRNATHP